MRRDYARKGSFSSERAIEVAAEIKARKRFEQDFFYGVTLAFQFAENLSIQRPFLGHGEQSRAGQDLFPQKCRPLQPRLAAGEDRHLVMRSGFEYRISRILVLVGT